MNCWLETLDKKNLNYTINFIEFTGSANPLISKELQPGDYLFIYSREEGRILYRAYINVSSI